MRWLRYALLICCLIALGACTGGGPAKHDLSPGVDPASPTSVALPAGWRWESYRGVEVGVPNDWGWGVGGQRIDQWCTNPKNPKSIVGRSGPSTAVGCSLGNPVQTPDPQTLIKNTGSVVAFESTTFSDGADNPIVHGGDRTLVTIGKVVVVIQAPEAMRTKIAATVHRVTVDHAGCPVSDPAGAHPSKRPPPTDVTKLRGVTAVSVCKYSGLLVSSLRYNGEPAARIIRQIAAAPKGGGPNHPSECVDGYGDSIIVLRVTSSTGESQIYARFSNCVHNGFDDGTTVRALTRDPMQALLKGPNGLYEWDGVLSRVIDTRR
ncbi:MAG: hypothetical protein JWR83_1192 [Aeromicrobium sp.]|nr:hypothetical protein [Aeromicrobium sp.]